MIRFLLTFVGVLIALLASGQGQLIITQETPLHLKVNPMIGTGGHGHTYPGATSPFGMVQLSPDTRLEGWDGCGGYHNSDSIIYGFSHTHLQGTGVSDYGDILLMPCTQFAKGQVAWRDRYKSRFNKRTEQAHAGFYSVILEDHQLKAQLTTTERVGIHKYNLKSQDTLTLIVDLQHRDNLTNYSIYPLDDSTIVGHRLSDNWAEQQHVYFAMRFDKQFDWRDQLSEIKTTGVDRNGNMTTQEMEYVPVFAIDFGELSDLTVRLALSFCDIEGAVKNLESEAPHSDFEKYKDANEAKWDEQLNRIRVKDENMDKQVIFYTSLYHSCTVPNLASDVDGRYRGTDLQVHQLKEDEGLHYTVFSLWDTFRSLHPLLSWIEPGRTRDFIRTMLRMYEEGGQLPVWELAANYTGCMIGYHSVPVISDAKAWKIKGFDEELALKAMVQAADSAHLGLDVYAEMGYIPSERESEGTSKTLEYCYDDACIAKFAASLGNSEADAIAERFRLRALSWRNILHPESHFIQPKRSGAWARDFDPTEVNFNYTEANGWQYTFFAPHDISGLMALTEGKSSFSTLVENQFTAPSLTSGRDQPDITGLIGQYAHGNEPSHHVAYLQSYTGNHWRTQELVDEILNTLYTSKPDGLCGNEDCGQMSAWYVLSSIGLYPVAPGVSGNNSQLVIGAPQFQSVIISPAKSSSRKLNRPLILKMKGDGDYVASANGEMRSWRSYDEILKGGTLTFKMTDQKENGFGMLDEDIPSQSIDDKGFTPVPAFEAPRTFQGKKTKVVLMHLDADGEIFWKEGEGGDWKKYKKEIWVNKSVELYAYAKVNGVSSKIVQHDMVKIEHDWTVQHESPYAHQYAASGPNTLVDGLYGGDEYRTGDWQGFYATSMQATIDLGRNYEIEGMSLGCVQDIRPWIWLPESVDFFVSQDGENFSLLNHIEHEIAEDDYEKQVYRFTTTQNVKNTVSARFVRVIANPRGIIPEWHLGAGFDRWTFVDEWDIRFVK
jgi:predicted alpha-1,2-mannosidase